MPVALLISVRPEYAKLIFSGEKTIELRRTRPRLVEGDLVFVYASSPAKCLMGAAEVVGVLHGPPSSLWAEVESRAAVSLEQFEAYFKNADAAYAIALGRLWPLAEPLELCVLRGRSARFRPPQSFRYMSFAEAALLGIEGFIGRHVRPDYHGKMPKGAALEAKQIQLEIR